MAREMKYSGIAWIGEIPKDWEVSELKYSIQWKSEKGYPDEQVLSLYRDYGVIPKDSRDDNHNVTSLDTSGYKVVDVGDFVINKMKAWQGSMGISHYRGIISPAYHVCRIINPNINKEYFHLLLRNQSYLPEYMRLSTGLRIGQWDLGFDDFKKIPFIIPPLDEQQRIVEYISHKCREIEEVIDSTKASIEEYKKYKQAVITEAVTKGIRTNRMMKDSGVEWIGEIPVDWEIVKIKMGVTKVGSGKTPSGGADSYADEGILFLRSQNVYDTGLVLDEPTFITSDVDESMKGTRVYPQDVLLNITGGSIGRCCIFPDIYERANVNQHVSIIRVVKNVFYPEYMHYYWMSSLGHTAIDLYQTGGNREGMSAEAIKNSPIPLIPLEEQREIIAYLDIKCIEIDKLISEKNHLLEQMELYKKSMIYEYVTGKKEVK